MKWASDTIDNFRPPADLFQMRMHYSIYITNFMSALDMLKEVFGSSFTDALDEAFESPDTSGDNIRRYLRELRNGVVHRGVDPTGSGIVVDGVTLALAPRCVENREGTRSFTAPAKLLRDIFIHCEINAKPVIECFLNENITEYNSVPSATMLDEVVSSVEIAPNMPDWVKEISVGSITSEMLMDARNNQINKLRNLLKPWVNK
ncbi:hypothetical protein [Brucella anthropi]|uniref:hypothetical protein n=1 Tax=Brucella anthropi TaxID=529 RepID=UPI003987F702